MLNRGPLTFMLVLLLLIISSSSVSAQEPTETPTPTVTPTITPTPSHLQAVAMSTGSSLLLVKQVTYGDIAVVVALLVNATVLLVVNMVRIPKMWIKP